MVVPHDLGDRHFRTNRLGDAAQLGQSSVLASSSFGLVALVVAKHGDGHFGTSLASNTLGSRNC